MAKRKRDRKPIELIPVYPTFKSEKEREEHDQQLAREFVRFAESIKIENPNN